MRQSAFFSFADVAILSVCLNCIALGQDTARFFDFIKAAQKKNLEMADDFVFEYQVEEEYLRDSDDYPEPVKYIVDCTFAAKDDMYRVRIKLPRLHEGRLMEEEGEEVVESAFDGKRYVKDFKIDQNPYVVGRERARGQIRSSPFGFVCWEPAIETFEYVKSSVSESTINLTIKKKNLEVFYTLDAQRGFLPTKVEIREDGVLAIVVSDIKLAKSENGMWYPVSAKEERLLGKTKGTSILSVKSLQIDTGLSSDYFETTIPPGSSILDEELQLRYETSVPFADVLPIELLNNNEINPSEVTTAPINSERGTLQGLQPGIIEDSSTLPLASASKTPQRPSTWPRSRITMICIVAILLAILLVVGGLFRLKLNSANKVK